MATNECILLRGKTPITDRTVSLCQGLIAEHSDNIGRLSAIFRQQHPSGKVMTSQGDLKPGAAFLCSQITNTYTVPPPPGAFRATAKCPPNDFNVGTIKL